MSSINSDSEFDDNIDFFKIILRKVAKPIHYKELSDHLILDYAEIKSLFLSYSDSEKLDFFKNQPKSFIVDSNGVVSCGENAIIEAFVELLQSSAPQHFLKIINATGAATTYFSEFSESAKLKFFKDHARIFAIQSDGFVKLSKRHTKDCKTLFEKNEARTLLFFKGYLLSRGPMYFTWFFDYLENSSYYRDFTAIEPNIECLLWNFFKSHSSDFIISDSGFVDLPPWLKSTVIASISEKEDEVVGFFIAKLSLFGSLLFPILLKLLQESTLDIRIFFAKYSLKKVRKFFTKYSNIFVLQRKAVSCFRTVTHDGFINFEDDKYPFEDQQEVIFFFLDCLKIECPKHYIKLSKLLQNSDIETDFKHAFVNSSNSVKHWFFKNHPELFYTGNGGYVSLHSISKLSVAGKRAIQNFAKKLKVSSAENFWTLINSAEASSKEFHNYFANFSPLDKFYFFKKFPTVFNVDSNGYVSCEMEPVLFPEVEVINMLVEKLKSSQPMHFEKLCLSVENDSEVSKDFFQPFSVSQKYQFLKSKSMYFCINPDGYVYVPVLSSELECAMSTNGLKSDHPSVTISKTNNVQYSPAIVYSDSQATNTANISEHGRSEATDSQCSSAASCSDFLPLSTADTSTRVISETNNIRHSPTVLDCDSIPVNIEDTLMPTSPGENDDLNCPTLSSSTSTISISDISECDSFEANRAQHSPTVQCSDSSLANITDTSKHASSGENVQCNLVTTCSDSSSISVVDIPEHVGPNGNDAQYSPTAQCSDSSLANITDTSKHASSGENDVQCTLVTTCSDSSSISVVDIPEHVDSKGNDAQYSPAVSYSDSPVGSIEIELADYVCTQHDPIRPSSNSLSLNSEDNSMCAISKATSEPCNLTVSHSDNIPASTGTNLTSVSFKIEDVSYISPVTCNTKVTCDTVTNNESTMLTLDAESNNGNSNLNRCSTLDSNIEGNVRNGEIKIHEDTSEAKERDDDVNESLTKEELERSDIPKKNPGSEVETRLSNTSEENKDDSDSAAKLPVSACLSYDPPSDADKLEVCKTEELVIKSLTDILKAYKQVHFEKLCAYNEFHSREFANYFSLYSTNEKYEFFKNHEEYFSMNAEGYISIPDSTQSTSVLSSTNLKLHQNATKSLSIPPTGIAIKREQSEEFKLQNKNDCIAEELLVPCTSTNFASSSAKDALYDGPLLAQTRASCLDSSNGTKQSPVDEDDIIAVLKCHLNTHKRMHCVDLCKAAENYFMEYSHSDKFQFFKNHLQHFCISDDNYVTLPSDIVENCETDVSAQQVKALISKNASPIPQQRTGKGKNIIHKLLNILKEKNEVHFEKLCTSDETVMSYFKTFTTNEKFVFFKNRPEVFSVSDEGTVFPKSIANLELSASCGNQASKPSISTVGLNSVQAKTEPKPTVLTGKMPADRQKSLTLGNVDVSVYNSKTKENNFIIETEVSGKDNTILSDKDLPDTSQTFVRHIASSAEEAYVIQEFKDTLKLHERMYYLTLCLYGAKLNKKVQDFFMPKLPRAKLNFFKRYPDHFYVSDDNYVSLSGTTESPFNTTSVVKIASVAPFKCLHISENEVMDDLIDTLKILHRVHFEKLCNHNDKITNFFISYSISERHEFYKSRPEYFCLSQDYVSLSKKFEYPLNTQSNAASSNYSLETEHPICNGNCKADEVKDNVPSPSEEIPPQFCERVFVGSVPVTIHQSVMSAKEINYYLRREAYGSKQTIVTSPSEDEVKAKSLPMCESAQVDSNTFDNVDLNEKIAIHSNMLGAQNAEASSSGVIDGTKATLVHTHHSHEAEPNISVDNLKMDIKNSVKQIYKLNANSETESVHQYCEPDFSFDHQVEIIGTLVRQLKFYKVIHFIKLCESCEERNEIVKNFFYYFPDNDKLDFLKSYPQYFIVDDSGFVTASNVVKTSSDTLISCEESLENRCSNLYNSKNRQVESTFRHKEHMTSGNEIYCNSDAVIKSAEEIAQKSIASSMNTQEYNKFRPLMNNQHEIIKTLVDQLKIDKRMHFKKLCKSSEKCNVSVKDFFHFFSDTEKLEFLKFYPQYFSVDNNGFITLCRTTDSSENVFVPSEELPCRCSRPPVEKPSSSNFQLDSEEKNCTIASNNSASVVEKVSVQDPRIKDLLNFFQSVLRAADFLHYEELFIELEDSNRFMNYRTLFKHSGKLKFFEDHPDIFTVQPGGFISLVTDTNSQSCEVEDACTESDCKRTTLVTDNKTSKSCDDTCEYEELYLSHYHMFTIKHSIKALQENQPQHFKQLVRDTCIENPDAKSFFTLFKTSVDLLDFFRLHSMYFIVDEEEMVFLKRSNVVSDEVLSVDDELKDIKYLIMSKAIAFYETTLKSKDTLSIRESETELQFAPGYVISFFSTNYPGSRIMNFFIENPNHFLLDNNGQITLKAMECNTEETLKNNLDKCVIEENNVVANNGTKTDKVTLKLGNRDYSKVENNAFVSSVQDNTKVSLKLSDDKLPLKVQEDNEIQPKILENIRAPSIIHDENEILLKKCNESSHTIRLLSQPTASLLSQLAKPTSSKSLDQLKNTICQTEQQDIVKNESIAKPQLYLPESFLTMPLVNHNKNINLKALHSDKDFKYKDKLIHGSYSDPVYGKAKVSADIKALMEIPKYALNIAGNQRAKQNKVKRQVNVSQSMTEIQSCNAMNKSNSLIALPPTKRDKNATFQHSLSSCTINHGRMKSVTSFPSACPMESVDQNMQNTDGKIHLSNRPHVQEALKYLNTIAKTYNSQRENQCVDFFKSVMREKAPRLLHIEFLRSIVSTSPDPIRKYLLQYSEDLLFFFYFHLDHFVINPLGYITLRITPSPRQCNNELEIKAANFFTLLICFIFKDKVSCDVLNRCLHLASEEVQLYLEETYETDLKLFFCNHTDNFYLDVFGNVSLQHLNNG